MADSLGGTGDEGKFLCEFQIHFFHLLMQQRRNAVGAAFLPRIDSSNYPGKRLRDLKVAPTRYPHKIYEKRPQDANARGPVPTTTSPFLRNISKQKAPGNRKGEPGAFLHPPEGNQ
jgi:hypothetical protein